MVGERGVTGVTCSKELLKVRQKEKLSLLQLLCEICYIGELSP